jgi:hypothetical protein
MTTETPATIDDAPEAAFAAALSRFQATVPHIGKGNTAQVKSDKGNYSYSYADLTDITLAALPLLAEHGFAWSAKTMLTPAGFILLSSLKHRAGWTETCEWPLPDPVKSSAQQVGSALTYGRRYTFTALTGVAPGGEDDDAQAAAYRPAADTRPDPIVAAKSAVWEQAQRLGMDMEGLREMYAQENDGQVIDDAAASDLHAFAKKLNQIGKNGLPLNKDGSVSKRQTTEEQRVEAGMMTAEQEKAHAELVTDITENEQKAERTSTSEPWTDVTVAPVGGAA